MNETTFSGKCACSCGTVKLQVKRPPLMRFFCHCSICQAVYKKPFADVVLLREKDVAVENMELIDFKRHRPPPNLDRGVCSSCEKPAVGFMTLPPGLKLCFLPSHMLDDEDDLPSPDFHIFYNDRADDIADPLPKYRNYLTSNLAFTKVLLPRLLTR